MSVNLALVYILLLAAGRAELDGTCPWCGHIHLPADLTELTEDGIAWSPGLCAACLGPVLLQDGHFIAITGPTLRHFHPDLVAAFGHLRHDTEASGGGMGTRRCPWPPPDEAPLPKGEGGPVATEGASE